MRPHSDDDLADDIRALSSFAERHGFNPGKSVALKNGA